MILTIDRIEAILAYAGPARGSRIHGEDHWRKVAIAGLRLAAEQPDVDTELVVLFALIHDMRRENDDHDPEHGPRAAVLAADINDDVLGLERDRLGTLVTAIDGHTRMGTSVDPTIGTCLDADRLNLWRVGIVPDPSYLSTSAAKRSESIEWSRELNRSAAPEWPVFLSPVPSAP